MTNIIDLYKQLFGRKGIADGNVIDMAEHGRVGGVSTGQSFKFAKEPESKKIIDDTVADYVYVGEASLGADKSEAVWKIKKWLLVSPYESQFPDGSREYKFVWDERASYTYI